LECRNRGSFKLDAPTRKQYQQSSLPLGTGFLLFRLPVHPQQSSDSFSPSVFQIWKKYCINSPVNTYIRLFFLFANIPQDQDRFPNTWALSSPTTRQSPHRPIVQSLLRARTRRVLDCSSPHDFAARAPKVGNYLSQYQ
jgi:hypothetical protein